MNIYVFFLVTSLLLGSVYYIRRSHKEPKSGEFPTLMKMGDISKKKRKTEQVGIELTKPIQGSPIVMVETKTESDSFLVKSKTRGEVMQDPSEFEALNSLYLRSLGSKKGIESLQSSLKDNSRIFIVYDKSGRVIGQAAILILDQHDIWGAFSAVRNLNVDTNTLILYNLCVEPTLRRRGIGELLLKSLHEYAISINKPNIVLFVDPINQGAIRLYQRMNYKKDLSHYAPAHTGREIMMRIKL